MSTDMFWGDNTFRIFSNKLFISSNTLILLVNWIVSDNYLTLDSETYIEYCDAQWEGEYLNESQFIKVQY